MHPISSWWYGVTLMLVTQHQQNSIRTATLTHNPRRTLVLLGLVSVRWSQSHSRRGCGAHGGSSVTPHTEPHSSPSLYCSPDLLPGCYTLSEPCSYSPYRTWELYCRKRQPIKLSQLREICWGITISHRCLRRYVSRVSSREALSIKTTSSRHSCDISSQTSIQLPLQIQNYGHQTTYWYGHLHPGLISSGLFLPIFIMPQINPFWFSVK